MSQPRAPRRLASFYSATAEGYRELWAPELLPLSCRLLDELPLSEARRVVDVGAGVGSLLPQIRRRAPSAVVAGTDVSHGMLALADAAFPTAAMDAGRLGLRDEVFDVALLCFVLFHLPHPPDAVEEAHRILRPGGRLGTITWGDEPAYPAIEIWLEELDAHGATPADDSLTNHDLVDSPDKMMTLLERSGFSSVHSWTGAYGAAMTPQEFMAHRTRHGVSRERYESLEPKDRAACARRVMTRLESLDAAGLLARAEVVYATGTRAA